MKKILVIIFSLLYLDTFGQNVEAQVVIDPSSTPTNTIAQFRIRTKVGTQTWVGISFYFLYQDGNLLPQSTGINTYTGVDDNLLTTTYGWGISSRFSTPFQDLTGTPIMADGETFTRRYIYGNSDETAGSNAQTLTTSWITAFTITFNNQLGTYPQGGYGYLQETTENINASLTNELGNNVAIDVITGSEPLGPPVVTPVLFTGYDVKCNDKGTLLTWSTATEINSSFYEIQKSLNGNAWTTIGQVSAAGNSSTLKQYQYFDLQSDDAFYRIRQVDLDGKFEYTNIKRINCTDRKMNVVIYPVPASHILNVVIRTDKAIRTELLVYDMTGRIIKRQTASLAIGNNNFSIPVAGLAIGKYLLKSSNPELPLNKNFTIAR